MSCSTQCSVANVRVDQDQVKIEKQYGGCLLVFDSLKEWRDYRRAVMENIRGIEADLLGWATSGT